MRKFLFKCLLILLAVGGVFLWLRSASDIVIGNSFFGMDDSKEWIVANSSQPNVMDTLASAHVETLRIMIPWERVEPAPGGFAWTMDSEYGLIDYPALFQRLEQRGITPIIVLSGGPAYLSDLYPQQPVMRDQLIASWSKYVSTIVEKFGEYVDDWQIGSAINHPESWGRLMFPSADAPSAPPDPALYAEMLTIAHDVITAKQTSDRVHLGSLTFETACAFQPLAYLQALEAAKVGYAYDVISVEMPALLAPPETAAIDACGEIPAQPSGIPSADSIRLLADFAKQTGGQQVFVHGLRFDRELLETAAEKGGTIPAAVSSDYLTRLSGLLLAYGKADAVFWALDPILDQPGLVALQSFANLNQTVHSIYINNGTPGTQGDFALKFRGGGKMAILAWQQEPDNSPTPMVIDGVQGYQLMAYSADSPSLKHKDGIPLNVDAGGNTALLVGEQPVLISGRPSDIKQSITQAVSDGTQSVKTGAKAKWNDWMETQKRKTARKVSGWVDEQQASLLQMLRNSFSQWFKKQLGLAKL